MRDDPPVVTLVSRAGDGDQDAWNESIDARHPGGQHRPDAGPLP